MRFYKGEKRIIAEGEIRQRWSGQMSVYLHRLSHLVESEPKTMNVIALNEGRHDTNAHKAHGYFPAYGQKRESEIAEIGDVDIPDAVDEDTALNNGKNKNSGYFALE